MNAAILTDVTKCIGCDSCVEACVTVNELPPAKPYRWTSKDGLAAERYCSVLRKPDNMYVRKQCRHCLEPACVSVCPVGALQKTEHSAVIYNQDLCMGCRYCMMSCPFGIPRYSWDKTVPLVEKCTLCYHTRLQQGRQPACTEICPTEATIFGDRAELLAEARRRLTSEPDKYIQKIYGESDVGGTSVLYISDKNLDFLAWQKDLGSEPLPDLTKPAMTAVPPVFIAVGAAMYGLHWIIGRRNKQMESNPPSDLQSQDDASTDS